MKNNFTGYMGAVMGMGMTKEEASKYYAEKDRLFAQRKASGEWPALTCESCQRGRGCCQRHHHHVGDCCTHCGNDERGDSKYWKAGVL